MGWVRLTRRRLARRNWLAAFCASELANVAMIFALAMMPMMAATGAAVDLSRALWVRARLSQALDAAGLAVGASVGLDTAGMVQLAQKYFDANYPEEALGTPGTLQVSLTGSVIHMSATAALDTTLMSLFGIDHLDVAAESEITRETKGLEVALVLDTTGSMASSGKIQALRSAATDLVNILAGTSNFPTYLKIGVVPFAISVKVDPQRAIAEGWMDTAGASSVAQQNFSGGKYAYWLYSDPGGMSNTPWTGCLEARPNQLDETDTVPDAVAPDTRWVPMFQPDEPDISESENPRSTDVVNTNQISLSSNFNGNYIEIPNVSVFLSDSITQDSSNISTSSDSFTLSGHGLSTGDGPFTVASTGSLPGASPSFSSSADYWVIRTGFSTFKLASSAANASAGVAVNITSTGSGNLTLSGVSQASDSLWVKEHSSRTGKDAPTPSVSGGHGMSTGDGPINLYVASAAGAAPGGIGPTSSYWVIRTNNDTIKLATSRANALSGVAVNITSVGSGLRAISEAPAGTSLAQQAARQRNWEKYVGKSFSGTNGPYEGCGMQAVTSLTNDKQLLLSRINALNASGYTNIPFGLSWGWRLISPDAPFTEGVDYNDPDTVKSIVLMTDGQNDVPSQNSTLNRTAYVPYGYGSEARLGLGIDTESEMEDEMDASLARLCNNIKALKDGLGNDRIRVYTIALMVNHQATIDRLQACATSPELFFNTPSTSELQTVFHTIAQDLSNLRVSK